MVLVVEIDDSKKATGSFFFRTFSHFCSVCIHKKFIKYLPGAQSFYLIANPHFMESKIRSHHDLSSLPSIFNVE